MNQQLPMHDDQPQQQPQHRDDQPQRLEQPQNPNQSQQQHQEPESENDLKRGRPSLSDSQQESESQQDENNDPGDDYQPLKRRRKVEPRGVPWFVMLERLKSYKERYGSLNVPSTYRQDPKLASWVQYQRYLFHHKEIPEERKQALDEIGFEWSILKPKSGGKFRTWDDQLALVKAYKDENGHTLIPYSHQADPSLGFWVSKQRKDFKHGQLPEDKIAKLDAIGFMWNPPTGRRKGSKKKKLEDNDNGSNRHSSWEYMFEKLKQFQAIHGSEQLHSRSDLNAIDKTLATWIKTQRHMYTIKKMSPERIAKLEGIGFAWRVGQDWKDFFARLKDYSDRTGTCEFPALEDPKLKAWVDSQKVSYKYRELSKEKVSKLKSIGFSFEIDEGLEALQASAPPVDDDALLESMVPALGKGLKEGTGDKKTKTNHAIIVQNNKAESSQQAQVRQGDSTTKLSEYNIAMHLAGLADKSQGTETASSDKEVVAEISRVHGMEGSGDQDPNTNVASSVEQLQKDAPATVDSEEDELLKLQEEICELQAEKVRLQEEKVLVQQEKVSLYQEIAFLHARKSELLTQSVSNDSSQDKDDIASKEANVAGEDNSTETTELQSQAKRNEEQLESQAARIQLQKETLQKLEMDLSEIE